MKTLNNHGRPTSDYLTALQNMTDDALYSETKDKIWLSAYASNNPRSDYHWQVDATYGEWERRGKLDNYTRAHNAVKNSL